MSLFRRIEAERAGQQGLPRQQDLRQAEVTAVQDGNPLLEGVAASAGLARGRVCILRSPGDCASMADGDILVARETTPEYVPAMLKAAAIVTDRGGVLSHAAIVARELGVPGVVGTGNATQKLKPGQEVTVDGTKGLVLADPS